ncbi:hypothetical protein J2D73_18485 [Acetobacter sacchari]|uniref:Uncharacterized protein n=1 Tax=Acetobacter sacchari TaxID=2661687 RepID=A0ABS3M0V7_9PROT|nr:hypothetical protein [Acetobacter sacchari]MBO1361773.1 hypothetical protein [Acetobacter sacchari]
MKFIKRTIETLLCLCVCYAVFAVAGNIFLAKGAPKDSDGSTYPTPALPAAVTAPVGAVSVSDFLVDFPDTKSGVREVVGPGRLACAGGELCYIYSPDNMSVYVMIDIKKLDRASRKAIIENDALNGTLYYTTLIVHKDGMLNQSIVTSISPAN